MTPRLRKRMPHAAASPAPMGGINMRYRAVWPVELREMNRSPMWFATKDCIIRLLNSSATSNYSAGHIAYGITEKLHKAHEEFVKSRVSVLALEETAAQALFRAELPKEVVQPLVAEWNANHVLMVTDALEGDCFQLTGPELQLLREALPLCMDRSAYRDPEMALTPELARWYTPITRVISGATTDSAAPANAIRPSNLEEVRAKLMALQP